MIYLVPKTLISALVIVAVGEISKRSTSIAALLISLPLTSILAMIWMHHEKASPESLAQLSMSIFWLVIPSLFFFVAFYWLTKYGLRFYPTLLISAVSTTAVYFGYQRLLEIFSVKI
jgi:uncharacterized membrane protein (GlpM family)